MDKEEVILKKGTRVSVGDPRKQVKERIIAEGIITKISEQEGVSYIYLDTGYFIVFQSGSKLEKWQ